MFNQPSPDGSEPTSSAEAAIADRVAAEVENTSVQTEHSGSIPVTGVVADQSTQAAQQMDEKPMQTEQLVGFCLLAIYLNTEGMYC